MAYDVSATVSKELQKVEGSYPVEMYVINASPTGTDYLYFIKMNQDTVGYQIDSDGDILSATTTYTAAYAERGDIGSNIEAEISSVSVTIPNVNRSIESIIQSKNYLRGCEVYLITTFADNLPSGSSAKYIGSDPDHNACMKEKYYIDTVTSNQDVVVFEGKSKFDIRNIIIPGRTYSTQCQWALKDLYLATPCDPDNNINATVYPDCDGTLKECRERENSSRYGGFASIPLRGFVIVR